MIREVFLEGNEWFPRLYHAFTILEYEEMPIVFVACDDHNGLYLCDCVESREYMRWVISRTNFAILNSLLDKKIGTYQALEMDGAEKYIVTYDYGDEAYHYDRIVFDAIQEDDLPEPSAVIRHPLRSAIKALQDLRIEIIGNVAQKVSITIECTIV